MSHADIPSRQQTYQQQLDEIGLFAMSRKAKLVSAGPSHLARVLARLTATPKLTLTGLKSLKLTLAYRNDHFGARYASLWTVARHKSQNTLVSHFVKEQLPRIRYANPDLDIKIDKLLKTKEEQWRPEMDLEYRNGKQVKIDLHEKWSTTILKELMDVAGGESWTKWKKEASDAGLPLVPGEENENNVTTRPTLIQPSSLQAFRASVSSATSSQVDSHERAGVSAALP